MLALLLLACSLPAQPPGAAASDDDSATPSEDPLLRVAQDTVDFGTVPVGGHSYAQVTITNEGLADLRLDAVALVEPDLTVAIDATPRTIAAAESADLVVVWSPDEMTELGNALRFTSNDPSAPEVTLVGRTPAPASRSDPVEVDFGVFPRGATLTEHVAIRNVGDADLDVTSIVYVATDLDMSIEPIETPRVVPPGEQFDVLVTYAPADDGDDEGVLTVHSDDPVTPVVLARQTGSVVPLPECAVAVWEFSGDADDTTGNRNDGVVHGAISVDDREGERDSAYYFDGTAYIDVPSSPSLDGIEAGGAITIAAWVLVDHWHVQNGLYVFPVVEKYDPIDDKGWTMVLIGPSTDGWVDQLDLAFSEDVLAPYTFETREWYFVATTFDTATDQVAFYVDGKRIGTAESSDDLGPTDGGDVHIGLSNYGLDEWATGAIDDVSLFDCALDDDEVQDLYRRY